MYPKRPTKPLTGWFQTVRDQSFPLRYYTTLYLKGLQNCRPSKLAVKKKADILGSRLRFSRFYVVIAEARVRYPEGAVFGRGAALQPLELQRLIAPFWKPLTHTILGLEAQGRGSTFRVHQAYFTFAILLSVY